MSNAGIRAMAVAVAAGWMTSAAVAQMTETQTTNFVIDGSTPLPGTQVVFSQFDQMGGTRQLTRVLGNAVFDVDLTFSVLNYSDQVITFDEWFYEVSSFFIYSPDFQPFGGGGGFPSEEEVIEFSSVGFVSSDMNFTITTVTLEDRDLPAGIGPTPVNPFGEPSVTPFPTISDRLDSWHGVLCSGLNVYTGSGALNGSLLIGNFDSSSSPAGVNIGARQETEASGTLSLIYEYRDVTTIRESAFAAPTNALDALDLFAFLNELETDDPSAEYTNNGVRDALDFDAFMSEFFPCVEWDGTF